MTSIVRCTGEKLNLYHIFYCCSASHSRIAGIKGLLMKAYSSFHCSTLLSKPIAKRFLTQSSSFFDPINQL